MKSNHIKASGSVWGVCVCVCVCVEYIYYGVKKAHV